MERLTRANEERFCQGIPCHFYGEPNGCNAPNGYCDSYCYFTSIADRLASYEDTGLTPEEVAKLAEAKADGRLVELPCKIGADVYTIEEDYFECDNCEFKDEATEINHYCRRCPLPVGRHCPYIVKTDKCEGFEIGEKSDGETCMFGPGKFGREGLEEFGGIDQKVYYNMDDAKAAKAELGKDNKK